MENFHIKNQLYIYKNILNKHAIHFSQLHYMRLVEFFITLKTNQYNNLFIPKKYNKKTYIGKRIITHKTIDKLWYCLEKPPIQGENIKIRTTNKFSIKVKKGTIHFDNNIIYNTNQNGKFIKIIINGKEEETYISSNNYNIYSNIVILYSMYKMNASDQSQLSGFSDGMNKTYIDKDCDIIKRLDNMFNGNKQIIHDKPNNSIYIYYSDCNVLVKIKERANDNYIILVPVKHYNSFYIIYPYSYRNIMLNSYYNDSVKYLFKTITSQLNIIFYPLIYNNLPDGFFHMHVVNISDDNKILLVLHTRNEIENVSNVPIQYIFEGKIIERSKNISTMSKNEIIQKQKEHSFYFLFDLQKNKHYLFSIKNNMNMLWDSEYSVALKTDLFGVNIADINYITGRPVIITIPK